MGRLELPVLVNKYLEPEYKMQIPNVNYPEIRGKHSAVCNEKHSESVFK